MVWSRDRDTKHFTDSFPLVHRLSISNYDTSRTAVKATSSHAGNYADLKEKDDQHIGTVENSSLTEEDEVFEWGEVIRGRSLPPIRL